MINSRLSLIFRSRGVSRIGQNHNLTMKWTCPRCPIFTGVNTQRTFATTFKPEKPLEMQSPLQKTATIVKAGKDVDGDDPSSQSKDGGIAKLQKEQQAAASNRMRIKEKKKD